MADQLVSKVESSTDGDAATGPRCVVCGDKANGMHYRALTCEGCKTFFRRNARNMMNLKCEMGMEAGGCEMDLYTRRHCAACRMKKCIDKGMQIERLWDKERLKTRKPISKKSQPSANVPIKEREKEEKKVEKTQCLAPKTESPTLTPNPSRITSEENIKLAHSIYNAYILAMQSTSPNVFGPNPNEKGQPSDAGTSSSSVAVEKQKPSIDKPSSSSVIPVTPSTSRLSTENSPLNMSPSPVNQSRTLQDLHNSSNTSSNQSANFKSSLMSALPKEIDLSESGFSETLIFRALDIFLGMLKHMITFAKQLPGFQSLTTVDQAALIKGAFMEFLILSSSPLYNIEKKCFESELWPEETWDHDMVRSSGLIKVLGSVEDIAIKVFRLAPDRTEMTLLYALSIFSADRKDLIAKDDVEKLQQPIADALQDYVISKHPDNHGFFAKLLMLLTDVRNVTEDLMDDVMAIKLKGCFLSPLMMEMFNFENQDVDDTDTAGT